MLAVVAWLAGCVDSVEAQPVMPNVVNPALKPTISPVTIVKTYLVLMPAIGF
jgi:hypothetical protein